MNDKQSDGIDNPERSCEDDSGGVDDDAVRADCAVLPSPSNDANESEDSSQRSRLMQTALINVSFLTLGVCEAGRGPTLLDLTEIYDTSVDVISMLFLIGSVGSLFGAFMTGYIMDKYEHLRHVFLFLFTCVLGLVYTIFPHVQHLYALFAVAFLQGFSGGSLDTGGNVQCLFIWRNRECGPYMHSIHASFALGAFLAPVLAAPFLSTYATTVKRLEAAGMNKSEIEEYLESSEGHDNSAVAVFFALCGGFTIIISLGFLFYGLKAVAHHKKHLNRLETEAKYRVTHELTQLNRSREREKMCPSLSVTALVFLLCTFFFLYVGLEYAVGIYLTTFSVKCRLQLSPVQGSRVTAVFWGAFATMRVLAIFAAAKVRPSIIMWMSFVLCLGGGIAAVFFAEHSFEVLQAIAGVLGFGMASIYATGLLWLEQFVTISSRMGAAFTIASSLGPDVYPPAIGQVIVSNPMFLMNTILATVVVCIGFFVGAAFFGKRVQAETKRKNMNDRDVELERHSALVKN